MAPGWTDRSRRQGPGPRLIPSEDGRWFTVALSAEEYENLRVVARLSHVPILDRLRREWHLPPDTRLVLRIERDTAPEVRPVFSASARKAALNEHKW